MSKKLFASRRWKCRIAKAQRREAYKHRKRKKKGPYGGTLPKGSSRLREQRLVPPEALSLIENPKETLLFFRRFERILNQSGAFLDFETVKTITTEIPSAILGIMSKFPNRPVRGSMPKDVGARSILEQSGFFKHVRHGMKIQDDCPGSISEHTGTEVDSALARELIWHGTKQLFGEKRDSEASYSILVEGMENTVFHANPRPAHGMEALENEAWWASVYADKKRSKVCFAVVDLGVGILKSARVKALRRMVRLVRKSTNAKILEDIFEGRLESRTGLDNRGKGLPSIKKLSDEGQIQRLIVISNSVYARIAEQDYQTMDDPFRGTLLYWEIEG